MPCPPPGDLPSPGIKLGSPALQADCLPAEPPGKPQLPGRRSIHQGQFTHKKYLGLRNFPVLQVTLFTPGWTHHCAELSSILPGMKPKIQCVWEGAHCPEAFVVFIHLLLDQDLDPETSLLLKLFKGKSGRKEHVYHTWQTCG